jgi:hypothetical protein
MTPFDAKQDTIFDHVAEQNLIAAKSNPLEITSLDQKPSVVVALEPAAQTEALESKADSFKRLATARVNKALKYIDLVKNLSNRSVYEYQPEQVATIMKALRDQVDALEQTFTQSEKKTPTVLL